MTPTIDDFCALVLKAKEWKPIPLCALSPDGSCIGCNYCRGAKAARDEVVDQLTHAMLLIEGNDPGSALCRAREAERIASYLGGGIGVSLFADGVRELYRQTLKRTA